MTRIYESINPCSFITQSQIDHNKTIDVTHSFFVERKTTTNFTKKNVSKEKLTETTTSHQQTTQNSFDLYPSIFFDDWLKDLSPNSWPPAFRVEDR
jgi:hypothetical protein